MKWVFWDLDFAKLDVDRHAESILARVLEYGRFDDVKEAMRLYSAARILKFFCDGAHPVVSERTRLFWEAYFQVESGTWPRPPAWRENNGAPWID